MKDRELFDRRPVRTEKCVRCDGCGTIVKHYALAPGEPIKGVVSTAVFASVVGAATIFESCAEASVIAKQALRPVAFEFNDQIVTIWPGSDPKEIARAWWLRQYNETPEQSAARR